MATTFPTALDAFTNPTGTDTLDSVTVPHASQHADANDAIEALEVKMGIDGSADTSSLDYRIAALEAIAIPTGLIAIWSGTIASIPTGWHLYDGTGGTVDLRDKFIIGAGSAYAVDDVGGSETFTPTGTVSQPTFTGSALAGHSHGVGTLANSSDGAGTPTGTIAWPVGVPTAANESAHTHSVTSNVAVSDHASHTHTYTEVVNHTHTINITDPGHTHLTVRYPTATGALSGFTIDTSMSGTLADNTLPTKSATTGITASCANPAGGVASGTTAGPSATLSHSVTNNAVTSGAGSAHTHTISWPVGVPTFTGSALGTHTHTVSGSTASVSAGTPAGTVSQPTFTGNAGASLPPYYALAFIQKV